MSGTPFLRFAGGGAVVASTPSGLDRDFGMLCYECTPNRPDVSLFDRKGWWYHNVRKAVFTGNSCHHYQLRFF
jgi:hypothetical protein